MSVNTKMTALADEIRTLSSTTEKIGLDEMATHVGEANMEITEQADLISQITTLVQQKTTPPSTDTNDATAGAGDILNGKTAYANGKKITGTIASKAAATYKPSTSDQTIASGQYLSGTQTIKGDTNLKAENIVSGVSIFGVTGTHSGAEDLDSELDTQESLISQLSTILNNKASGGSSGAANHETCTVTFTCSSSASYTKILFIQYTTLNSDGEVVGKTLTNSDISSGSFSIECLCNTCITGILPPTVNTDIYCTNIKTNLYANSSNGVFYWGTLEAGPGDTTTFIFM